MTDERNPSSQAPKLPSLVTLICVVALAVPLFFAGCRESKATATVHSTDYGHAICNFDMGVIYSEQSSYLCIPLDRFGVDSAKSIESIESSCECVKPSLIKYSESSSSEKEGVLFTFVPEKAVTQARRLAVEVRLIVSGGDIRTRTAILTFIHVPGGAPD